MKGKRRVKKLAENSSSGPITSWQIDGKTMETVTDFIFLGSKITADGDCSHEIKLPLLFNMLFRFGHSFSSKEQVPFNLMTAVTICSDFGALENKVCHCFHCFSIYVP